MFVLLYGLNAQIIYLKTGKSLIILQKPGCIYHFKDNYGKFQIKKK